ncbi:MAG: guanylate kinase [Candidatus Omnitrophota bacterium]
MSSHAKGTLFIISAPSGSGKTTLCKKLLADGLDLVPSVSVTTRPPRPGEKNGADYHFIKNGKFKELIRHGGFLEHEENFGNLYGTPKKFIKDALDKGKSVVLSIDVKGAMKVRGAYPKNSVMIFILPPSMRILKKRLRERMSDGEETMAVRLRLARKEMACKDRYDYRVVNDELHTAYRKLKNIIKREIKKRQERSCRQHP